MGRSSATRRRTEFLVAASGVAAVLAFVWVWFAAGNLPGDAFTYVAAGERLNAGHEVYRLLPGDNPVLMEPPYPPYPLLSPPLIAVLMRPLALLPGTLAPWLWWAGMLACEVIAIALLVRRGPIVTGLALIALCFPIAVVIGVGNVDALVLLAVVGCWVLLRERRDVPAGVILAVVTSLKVTPLIFAWWLLVHRRGQALAAFGVSMIALAGITVLGSYPSIFLDYIEVVRATAGVAPGGFSLAGIGRGLGLSPDVAATLGRIALVAAALAMLVLRRSPVAGYSIGGLMLWLGSPAAAAHTPAVGLAALAPLAGRAERRKPATEPEHGAASAGIAVEPTSPD